MDNSVAAAGSSILFLGLVGVAWIIWGYVILCHLLSDRP